MLVVKSFCNLNSFSFSFFFHGFPGNLSYSINFFNLFIVYESNSTVFSKFPLIIRKLLEFLGLRNAREINIFLSSDINVYDQEALPFRLMYNLIISNFNLFSSKMLPFPFNEQSKNSYNKLREEADYSDG